MFLFETFGLAVLMFAVVLLTLAMLIDFWLRANLEMSTKVVLTQVYTFSWTLLFADGWVFLIGQILLVLLYGWVTARSLRGVNQNGNNPTTVS